MDAELALVSRMIEKVADRDRKVAIRLLQKIDFDGLIPKSDPSLGQCWVWSGSSNGRYGQLWVDGSHRLAHRVSYRLFSGPMIDGMEIHHQCENTFCVRPDHLEQVTRADQRARHRPTHCKHGHELTPENSYVIRSRGTRNCRICVREAGRRRDERKRAEQSTLS